MKLNMSRRITTILAFLILATSPAAPLAAADELGAHYRQVRQGVTSRDPQQRLLPQIPPKGQRIRVIFDTDAKNEIDDIWAIALAALLIPLLRFERWRYALATWVLFWSLTVLFVALPAQRW